MSSKKPRKGKLLSAPNTREQNFAAAIFGGAARTERQLAILRVVGTFEHAMELPEKLKAAPVRYSERLFDLVARPLLVKALSQQDPEPFREFVAAIEAAKGIRTSGPHRQFHWQALRLAEEVVMDARMADVAVDAARIAEAARVEEARNPGAAAVFRMAEAAGVDVCLAEMAVAAGLAGELMLPQLPEELEDAHFEPGKPLPVTLREFKAKLKERYWPTLRAEKSDEYVRRECKVVGIVFKADKVGRRKGGKPTK